MTNPLEPGYSTRATSTAELIDIADLRASVDLGSNTDHDDELEEISLAAQAIVSGYIGKDVASVKYTDYFPRFASKMALASYASGTLTVKYIDDAGDEQTVDSGDYLIDQTSFSGALLRFATVPTSTLSDDFENPITAAYTTSPSGGAIIAQAVRGLASDMFASDNRLPSPGALESVRAMLAGVVA